MKALIIFLGDSLREKNGKPSSARIFNAFALLNFVPILSFGFILVLKYYPSLIIEYAFIIAGLIASLLGIQTWKKNIENKETTNNNNSG